MEKIAMDSKDISRIIKACKSAGVSELKFEGLEVKFGKFDEVVAIKPQSYTFLSDNTSPTDQQLDLIGHEYERQEKSEKEDLANEMLMISDPLKYEEQELMDEPGED